MLARRYPRAGRVADARPSFLAHPRPRYPYAIACIGTVVAYMKTYEPLGDRYADYVGSIWPGRRLSKFFASTLDLAELEGGGQVLN